MEQLATLSLDHNAECYAFPVIVSEWPVLMHHVVGAKPVVPTMLILEWFVRAAKQNGNFNELLSNCSFQNIRHSRMATIQESGKEDFYFDIANQHCRVLQDIRNNLGKVIRPKVLILEFDLAIDPSDQIELEVLEYPPSSSHYEYLDIGSRVWSISNHPYRELLKSRTGRFYWSESHSSLLGLSELKYPRSTHWSTQPEAFATPCDAAIAGVQQLSFFGEWVKYPGIPEDIGSLQFHEFDAEATQLVIKVQPSRNSIKHASYDVTVFDELSNQPIVSILNYSLKR